MAKITGLDGADALARLDKLVSQAREKVRVVRGPGEQAPEEQPQAAEIDFAKPGVVESFLGQVRGSGGGSPFAHHELDPARVAELLDFDEE